MKSPFYFIVESLINKRYNNTKTISGLEIITSTSEEDYISSNRFAKVIEVPLGYKGPISSGDILLVHHNVFKYYYDMKGNQKSGKSFFKDDKFFIEPDQFYMYKKDDIWYSYDKYCFVKPIDAIVAPGVPEAALPPPPPAVAVIVENIEGVPELPHPDGKGPALGAVDFAAPPAPIVIG